MICAVCKFHGQQVLLSDNWFLSFLLLICNPWSKLMWKNCSLLSDVSKEQSPKACVHQELIAEGSHANCLQPSHHGGLCSHWIGLYACLLQSLCQIRKLDWSRDTRAPFLALFDRHFSLLTLFRYDLGVFDICRDELSRELHFFSFSSRLDISDEGLQFCYFSSTKLPIKRLTNFGQFVAQKMTIKGPQYHVYNMRKQN